MTVMGLALLTSALLFPAAVNDDTATSWGPSLHQIVVVKASTLMPPPLQRLILRHRYEILNGCLDVLREEIDKEETAAKLPQEFQAALNAFEAGDSFANICYRLGRLSALVGEYSPPPARMGAKPEALEFRDFVSQMVDTFPLVITREGEAYLREGSLPEYLEYVKKRSEDRATMLERALADLPDKESWKDQRSPVYGLASLCYNDMVLDTARIWLFLWQEAGGDISGAPYFRLATSWSSP
jgi:hypothetical protein